MRTNAFDILVHVWNLVIVRLLTEVFEDGHISVLRWETGRLMPLGILTLLFKEGHRLNTHVEVLFN